MMLIRDAADALSNCVHASCGEANTRPQWRLHCLDKIRDRVGDDVVESFREFILRPPHDEATVVAEFEWFCAFADGQFAAALGRCTDIGPVFAEMSR